MSAPFTSAVWAERLRNVPVWVFHGEKDDLAPVEESLNMIRAFAELGVEVKSTIMPGADHYVIDTYWDDTLYEWLLEHRLGQ